MEQEKKNHPKPTLLSKLCYFLLQPRCLFQSLLQSLYIQAKYILAFFNVPTYMLYICVSIFIYYIYIYYTYAWLAYAAGIVSTSPQPNVYNALQQKCFTLYTYTNVLLVFMCIDKNVDALLVLCGSQNGGCVVCYIFCLCAGNNVTFTVLVVIVKRLS